MPVILIWVSALLLAQQPAPAATSASLDFDFYRTRVQPIFLAKRPGYTRCFICHSGGGAVGFLQPLSPGATTWDEAQSRRNFEAIVARLVAPGDPLKSRLLMHPLAPEAGGDSFHNGGRQFTSQNDPEWQTIATWVRGSAARAAAATSPASSLDFDFFRTRVQPVFLAKRPGYTRCVVCHSGGGAVGFLQPLSPGAATWDEAQSRRNFEAVVARLVAPGDPLKSRLLMHPLAPEAGGDSFHNGGRQFNSQDEPEWQTIATWVRGRTAGGSVK